MMTIPSVLTEKPFSDPVHQPFYWSQGEHAALLLHGFPGTPAEMRPLGELLNAAGWTVQAPLLPGFGPDIETLPERNFREWLDAARDTYVRLCREHESILLIGNSMGGALAMTLAAERRPSGLVLLAPFTGFAARWQEMLWPLTRRFVSQFKPFEHADFSTPEIRRVVQRMCNGADPADAKIREFVRGITVPMQAIDQLKQIGRLARKTAPQINAPILLLQGRRDAVVSPRTTRRLLKRFSTPVKYFELDGAHDLVEPDCAAWGDVKRCVLEATANLGKPEIALT
jgi:carboxylesterase